MITSYVKLLRVKHYIKNGLIFLPLLFGQKLFEPSSLIKTVIAFIAFCLASSIVYIINDIQDAPKDRLHPEKCHRPIASGAITSKKAIIVMIVLTVLVAMLQIVFIKNWLAFLVLCLYVLLNLAYSAGLKNIPIIDIAILGFGFFLRVVYGSLITGIAISGWLYLTVLSMSFYLGLGKRRNEKRSSKADTRKVLQYYNQEFLDKNMYLCLTLTIVFYSLWCVIAPIHEAALWTIPFVLLICMKYSLDVEGNSNGDPVEVLIGDKILLGLCALYMVTMLLMLYLY